MRSELMSVLFLQVCRRRTTPALQGRRRRFGGRRQKPTAPPETSSPAGISERRHHPTLNCDEQTAAVCFTSPLPLQNLQLFSFFRTRTAQTGLKTKETCYSDAFRCCQDIAASWRVRSYIFFPLFNTFIAFNLSEMRENQRGHTGYR